MRGRRSWLIDQAFPAADTFDFAGSVRCDAVGKGLFSAVAWKWTRQPARRPNTLCFRRVRTPLLSSPEPVVDRGVNS